MNTKIIDDPYDINIDKSENHTLLINIDNGCLIPEYVIERIFTGNPALRNKIIKNTKKLKFDHSNTLILIKPSLVSFLAKNESSFKNIYYVTTRDISEYPKIKEDLLNNKLSINYDIIHPDYLCDLTSGNKLLYISSDNSFINKLNRSITLFKLNLFD